MINLTEIGVNYSQEVLQLDQYEEAIQAAEKLGYPVIVTGSLRSWRTWEVGFANNEEELDAIGLPKHFPIVHQVLVEESIKRVERS